jgi:hypothetical protein
MLLLWLHMRPICQLSQPFNHRLRLFPALGRFQDGSDLVAVSQDHYTLYLAFYRRVLILGPAYDFKAKHAAAGCYQTRCVHIASPPPGCCSRVAVVSAPPRLLSILRADPAHCETFNVRHCPDRLCCTCRFRFRAVLFLHGLLLGCDCYTWLSAPGFSRHTITPVKRWPRLYGNSLSS